MLKIPFKKKKDDDEEKNINLSEKGELEAAKKRKPRKKKELPPKPWGKLERFIVLLFLLAAPVFSLIFFINSKNSKNASQVSLVPAVVQNVIPQAKKDPNELKNHLVEEIKNLEGSYGVWVQAIDNSYTVSINENDSFDGASLFKVPLMIGYYQEIDKRNISPSTNYLLRYSDQESGAGILANMPAGTAVSYKDIVEAMGKNSDNTAFSIMISILGVKKETDVINQIGMNDTDFKNSQTTPHDIGTMFYQLENKNLISNNSKTELLSFLENTDFENLIPAGLPDNIKVAHKYGADDGELNDAGIVYTPKPFVLVILSKNINLNEANYEFPKITKLVYDWATK